MNKKIIFKPLDKDKEEKVFYDNTIILVGIKQNRKDGLYSLCSIKDKKCIYNTYAIYDNGIYYVDFNEISEWADWNIVVGTFIND